MAVALAGAWRRTPKLLPLCPIELAVVAPYLVRTGAGALGWWCVRHTELRAAAPAHELRQAYRFHALQAAEHERHLRQAVTLLRSAGIEPILIKGWSAARLYPETGLRPYGDLDLCVHPDQLLKAMEALGRAPGECTAVELHEGVPDVSDRRWEDLYRRSRLCRLEELDVRVLGAEDQLRQLCLHFWRHNACRALWLCDIGAALEAAPADFDWDYCFSGDRRLVDWTLTICALACRLLDARCDHPAVARRAERLPPWLLRTVLWKWGPGVMKRPLTHYLRHPAELPAALLYRWFDPLKVCYRMQLPANRSLAWIQVVSLVGRPVELAVRARRIVAKRLQRWRRAPVHAFSLHLQGESRFL